jgi:hypothetical protein
MTDAGAENSFNYLSNDVEQAASVLLQLKADTLRKHHVPPHSSNMQNKPDTVHCTISALVKNSAWTFLFDRIMDDLSSIECVVMEKLQIYHELIQIRSIPEIFKEFMLCTANGYVVIQHGVTVSCNHFRNLLQLSFKGQFENTGNVIAYERVCLEVMHNINRYEHHIWLQVLRNSEVYSVETELRQFQKFLYRIRVSLQHAPSSQRKLLFDCIKQDFICIRMTGLRSVHACQHIVHILETKCAVWMEK